MNDRASAHLPTLSIVTAAMLPDIWRARAADLDPYAPAAAEAFRRAAEELQTSQQGREDSVSLREAHVIGGYSVDHLQRLVRRGTIANVGTKHRIRIRRTDVPVRPGHAAARAIEPGELFSPRRQAVVAVIGKRRKP